MEDKLIRDAMRTSQGPGDDASDLLPTIAGVALDMDGLLFDTEALYWQVGQTVLGRRGHQFTRILQQKMMGRVGVNALQQMVEHHGLSDTAELLLAESDEIYAELIFAGVPAMPGLDRLIESLRRSGLPFGVATSSQRKFAERILAPMPWYSELRFILTGDDVLHGNEGSDALHGGEGVVSVPNECTHDHCFDGVYAIAKSLDDPLVLRLLGPGLAP